MSGGDKETRRQGDKQQQIRALLVSLSPLLLVLILALGLRLLAWRWHELYALGGDESEYFTQALQLLRNHVYVELNLMRPPLYTGFLAIDMYLFDSLVQRLRLVQAVLSALTVVPIYLVARRLFGRRVALMAALLAALNYTFAAHATELLTETLFVFGLATLFWLLVEAAATADRGSLNVTSDAAPDTRRPPHSAVAGGCWPMVWAALAGVDLGALALVRSLALPLLPLGALWLLLQNREPRTTQRVPARRVNRVMNARMFHRPVLGSWFLVLVFVLGSVLVILPWTIRNYATYGALILVDTAGAENLWLDNNPAGSTPDDPLGREAAKRQLYALGDDRGARQRLAAANGAAAIEAHPAWFALKAWGEARKFFALEYFDDMRERRAIWVPPIEVWLRLLLGDGMWLALVFGGTIGLWLAPGMMDDGRSTTQLSPSARLDPRWIFMPWALYTFLTAMVFHVELRYRLPLYPVLLPYAAWMLAQVAGRRSQVAESKQSANVSPSPRHLVTLSALTCLVIAGITLLHRPYIGEAWMLARKHARLWQADRALARGDAAGAAANGRAALDLDPDSTLARVALARAALAGGDRAGARAALDDAIATLRSHPYAHLLRGAMLRDQGDLTAARAEFGYEQASLEDLQRWSWDVFAPFAAVPSAVDVGGKLDLGYVRGFWLPEPEGFRWSKHEAQLLLAAPSNASARLDLELNGGRPAGAPPPHVTIVVGDREIGQLVAEPGWQVYSFAIPVELIPDTRRLVLAIRSDIFRPRDFDRASPDNRELGVMVRAVEIQAA